MTKRAKPAFIVKEGPGEKPWICIEFLSDEDGISKALYGFDLKPGTSIERAEEIADYLQKNLANFTITELP